MINVSQYGKFSNPSYGLCAAEYKLAVKLPKLGRQLYMFCMCPGGFVVGAASENGMLVTNGMSFSGRNGTNANSALLVNVAKEDFCSEHPLAGMYFQQRIERKAFEIGKSHSDKR